MLKLIEVLLRYEVDLVPNFKVLVLEHVFRNSNILQYSQYSVPLIVSMRMRDVSHVHQHLCPVDLLKCSLKALNQSMRQVGNEADSVEHKTELTAWESEPLLSGVQGLEEKVLALKL